MLTAWKQRMTTLAEAQVLRSEAGAMEESALAHRAQAGKLRMHAEKLDATADRMFEQAARAAGVTVEWKWNPKKKDFDAFLSNGVRLVAGETKQTTRTGANRR